MNVRSVILIGGPDAGKTNFIGRLWIALRAGEGALRASEMPEQIEYVEQVVEHLHKGEFAPRTSQNMSSSDGRVVIPICLKDSEGAEISNLIVPDVSGEVWKRVVETGELDPAWTTQLKSAAGALIFVRVLSSLNVNPPDWVASAGLMSHREDAVQPNEMPTQVMLCEFLRLLELTMSERSASNRPRIAVVVTAWDLLDEERSSAGPQAYLKSEYPLFFGRLADLDHFDVMVFAMSIVGGDLEGDREFCDRFLDSDIHSTGFLRIGDRGETVVHDDMTLPVAWVIGVRSID